MSGPAFVAGASGYTGQAVVSELLAAGIDTVAHIRPNSSRLEELRGRFVQQGAQVDTTPWEDEAMGATFERLQPSYVFALLGITRASAAKEAKRNPEVGAINYERIDYGLTAMLIRSTEGIEPPPRFVYLSSLGVTDKRPGNAYLLARWKVEKQLAQSGLPYTVARPSFVSGSDREEFRPGERIATRVGDALLGLGAKLGAGKMKARYGSLSAKELAAALVRLALDPKAARQIFEADRLRATG